MIHSNFKIDEQVKHESLYNILEALFSIKYFGADSDFVSSIEFNLQGGNDVGVRMNE